MFGAKLTLIVLTGQRLARIDMAGSRRRLRVERALSCPRNASSELAASVAIAYRLGELSSAKRSPISLGSPQSRSVIVLSDDIWNDSIQLPLDVTVLLQENELQQALALEAENYSGIPALQSHIVYRKLLDVSGNLVDVSSNLVDASSVASAATGWWVAQLATSDMASMTTAAQACGFRLIGAAHTEAYWRGVNAQPMPAPDFADQLQLMDFGKRWASALSSGGLELVIRPEDKTSGQSSLGWLQTVAALVTALACAGTYQHRSSELNASAAQLKQLQETLAQHEATAGKLKSIQSRLQQTQQRLSQAETTRQERARFVVKHDRALPAGNAQWLALFDALAHETPEDCWIESWTTVDGQPTLCGRAISAQTIQELARQLEQTLHSRAWQVHSPIIHKGDDGLLHFELRLALPTHVSVEPTSSQIANPGGTT